MNIVNQYKDMINTVRNHVTTGASVFQAAKLAESDAIAAYKDDQREALGAASIHAMRAIRAKDRSKYLKVVHAVSSVMNARKEQINGVLALFAANVTDFGRLRAWQSKVQHALTVRVRMGEKSGHTMELDTEYKGFDDKELTTYLLTQTKEQWVKRANGAIYGVIAAKLADLLRKPKGAVEWEMMPNITTEDIKYQFGVLSYKTTWKVLSSIAFRAALADKYVNEDGMTDKLEQMHSTYDRQDRDTNKVAGDHYNIVRLEDIREEEKKVRGWIMAKEFMEEIKPLIYEWNANMEAVEEDIRMPVDIDLEDMEVKKAKALAERLTQHLYSLQTTEFFNKLQAMDVDPTKHLEALMA